jgi:hypothetical protein
MSVSQVMSDYAMIGHVRSNKPGLIRFVQVSSGYVSLCQVRSC